MAKRAKPPIICTYCGKTAPPSREHTVQRGIGGGDIFLAICHECNQSFSDIDKELVINSPLAILARRELGKDGPALTWDVDEKRNGLLLEARQTQGTDSMTLLPQIIFDDDMELFYDDHDEIDKLGLETMQKEFFARLKDAVALYDIVGPMAKKRDHRGKDMLKYVNNKHIRLGYRYPARICAPTNVAEYDGEIMFELHYQDESDIEPALDRFRKLDWHMPSLKGEIQLGSELPEIHMTFRPERIIRAITKIGMNLLAKHCSNTNPNNETYAAAVSWIKRCEHGSLYGNYKTYGFIKPEGVKSLACPKEAHKFRLTYNEDIERWMMYASFFGNQAAAFVSIFGPNRESWKTLEIVAPFGKNLLTPKLYTDYMPLEVEIAGTGPEMLPSLRFTNGETRVRKERGTALLPSDRQPAISRVYDGIGT